MPAGTIDLAKARADRAAAREITGGTINVPLNADTTLVLPVELPIDTLAPIRDMQLDRDFGGMFQVRDTVKAEQLLRDLLTVRPELLSELLAAATNVLERLLCSCADKPWEDPEAEPPFKHDDDPRCQWTTFVRWRPSPQDLRDLVVGLWGEYGADLGEAFAPSASAGAGGATSNQTSAPTAPASTPDASGSPQDTPTS